MTEPVLEYRDVTAAYNGAVVVRNLSMSVAAGETVGLIGRNGAGKTTTLMCIYRVPNVTGDIYASGTKLGRRSYDAARHGIGLVPQGRRIFPNLTVRENILLGDIGQRSGAWNLDTIMDLFPNLAKASKRPGNQLSGGEQQMLAIARALILNPQVMLLDEPTEGLAPVAIDELVRALRSIQQAGTALLLVEQHIALIQELATRFMALGKGVLIAEGGVEELSDRKLQQKIAM